MTPFMIRIQAAIIELEMLECEGIAKILRKMLVDMMKGAA